MNTQLPPLHEVISALDLQSLASLSIMNGTSPLRASNSHPSTTIPADHQAPLSSLSFFTNPDLLPVTSGNLESRPLFRSSPFQQVAQGDPLIRWERDQIWSTWSPSMVNNSNQLSGPTPLGALDPESLTPNQAVFIFGILCIMARLKPRFEFKYGGLQGKQIGLRLTFFGHTIVLDPVYNSVQDSRVTACRRALWKLRKFNPHWLCPPSDGPTGPEWDWIKLVEAFCNIKGIELPLYGSLYLGKLWHYDLTLNGSSFRTGSPCETSTQAQNTAAHLALHSALISDNIADHILPATDPSVVIKKEEEGSKPKPRPKPRAMVERLNGRIADHSTVPARSFDDVLVSIRAERGRKIKRGRHSSRYGGSPSPKPLKFAKLPKVKKPNLGNANRVPLTHNRVAPLEEKPEPRVDRFATLKAIQKAIETKDLSYHSILIRICDILGVNAPAIRHEDDPDDPRPMGWCVRATFDESHPYLNRASPIMLARLPKSEDKGAISLGMKKLILYLLNMAKEDAGLSSEDSDYAFQLRLVKDLEKEIQSGIDGNVCEIETAQGWTVVLPLQSRH
ncbi:hypothetical protein N7478_009025 [Penicillium angulare]|uniref:uncharacterized protein n=1 Tax=Penicillium angulare TaxID=116970 RepID=UPI0025409A1E|nr:uncharacterized protein N7478_009025 [Penicillium angulare]KAJ5273900.1 hypothetical protein N7478_009025 [Penicillium angulare]